MASMRSAFYIFSTFLMVSKCFWRQFSIFGDRIEILKNDRICRQYFLSPTSVTSNQKAHLSINVNKNIANVMYASEKRAEEEQEIFLEQGNSKLHIFLICQMARQSKYIILKSSKIHNTSIFEFSNILGYNDFRTGHNQYNHHTSKYIILQVSCHMPKPKIFQPHFK